MSRQVLILQSDSQLAKQLSSYFTEWGDQVWQAASIAEAQVLLEQHKPGLVIIDLQLLANGWQDIGQHIPQKLSQTNLLFTTAYPNPQQEIQAKQIYDASVFLRLPFTRSKLEQALHTLKDETPLQAQRDSQAKLPKVRVPVRLKITLPYVILALILALGAAYVVSQVVLDTVKERFTNQLIEVGKLGSDWMVNEEKRLLETLRLLSYTEGVAEAIAEGKAERLREIALPLAINYQEENIEILDMQGASLLSLHHYANGNIEDYEVTQGETIFSQWAFVQNVLQADTSQSRDKYAGLAQAPWGDVVYVAGPVLNNQSEQVGVILVGKSLPTLVEQIRQDTFAQITIYDFNGQAMASTLPFLDEDSLALTQETSSEILKQQDEVSLIRPVQIASLNYSEILGAWEIGGALNSSRATSSNDIGLIGVALAETFLARPGQITRLQIFTLTTITFLLVIALGIYLANLITHPLRDMVTASAEVAQGNLNVQVKSTGDDEVAVLAHSFNEMVAGLREGSIYRDLFGRTVSPEVREQLRQGFAKGDVNLKGQEAIATVLMSNIRDFTTISELEIPTTIMGWLNEYFETLTPIINSYGGIISKFEGDEMLIFFGILPRPLLAQESAYKACQAALAMLEAIEQLNKRRIQRDEPIFRTGIAINTGPVTAGALGSVDRLHYTIIGDTVNTTTRLEGLTRQFSEESNAVISQHTLFALNQQHHEFKLEAMGAHTVRGKVEQLLVYQLQSLTITT